MNGFQRSVLYLSFYTSFSTLGCTGEQVTSEEDWSHGLCQQSDQPTIPEVVQNCSSGKCVVSEGEFRMGACDINTQVYPQRLVTLSKFSMDQTEVSIGAWRECVDAGQCSNPAEKCALEQAENGNTHPVTCIDWEQAREYCTWKGGDLPTEAQWEKAARGTDGRLYPWGDVEPTCESGNAMYFSSGPEIRSRCVVGTVPVASTSSQSPYGLMHMSGNVYEWVRDDFDARYYQRATSNEPMGPTDGCYLWQDGWKDECPYKVIRGGAYNTLMDRTTTVARSFAKPAVRDRNIGFRCAYPE